MSEESTTDIDTENRNREKIGIGFLFQMLVSLGVGVLVWFVPPAKGESFARLLFNFILVAILVCGVESAAVFGGRRGADPLDKRFARRAFPFALLVALLTLGLCLVLQTYDLHAEVGRVLLSASTAGALFIGILTFAVLIETIKMLTAPSSKKK